jgi:hypothetical protein
MKFQTVLNDISRSHGGGYEADGLLGAPCSLQVYLVAVMMETVRTSETSVYFIETTWRYIPEDCHVLEILKIAPVNTGPY